MLCLFFNVYDIETFGTDVTDQILTFPVKHKVYVVSNLFLPSFLQNLLFVYLTIFWWPKRRRPEIEPVLRLQIDDVEEDGRIQRHLRLARIFK